MSFNLLDEAKKMLPNNLISNAAASLGESEGGIQKALSGALPSILSGLLHKSSDSGSAGLLDIAKTAASSGILSNLTDLFSNGGESSSANSTGGGISSTIMGWLKSIFGEKLNNIISAIAGFAGIKSSSASSILSMAAPAVLAPIGKYATDNNLGPSGLTSFLQSQKNSLLSLIPSGFNLAGALGLSGLGDIGNKVSKVVSSTTGYAEDTVKKATGSKWLWPLLLLLAIAAAVFFFAQKGCKNADSDTTATGEDTTKTVIKPVVNNEVVKVTGKLDTISGDFIYDLGDTISIDLPNNAGNLKVGKWSTEARLFTFLNNPDEKIDTANGNWFDFTNVRFKTGGSVITDDSYTQLKNLVAIVKAFPNAQFKLGGYTDNTGDATANIALSKKRAEAVAAQIVKLGAEAKQIVGAAGYGAEFPVGDNSTPEGRAVNRRVSVNVKAK